MDIKVIRLICGTLMGIAGVIGGVLVIVFGPEGSTIWGYLLAIVVAMFGYMLAMS